MLRLRFPKKIVSKGKEGTVKKESENKEQASKMSQDAALLIGVNLLPTAIPYSE